jgi:hypothetical protein
MPLGVEEDEAIVKRRTTEEKFIVNNRSFDAEDGKGRLAVSYASSNCNVNFK